MSKTEAIGCSPKTLWLGFTRSFLPGVIEALAPAIVAFALAIAVLSGVVFLCATMGATDWPGYSSQVWSGVLFVVGLCVDAWVLSAALIAVKRKPRCIIGFLQNTAVLGLVFVAFILMGCGLVYVAELIQTFTSDKPVGLFDGFRLLAPATLLLIAGGAALVKHLCAEGVRLATETSDDLEEVAS